MSYPVCVSRVLIERRSSPLRWTELPRESRPAGVQFILDEIGDLPRLQSCKQSFIIFASWLYKMSPSESYS